MDANLLKIFADRLKELMSDEGIKSISEFARQSGLPRTTINNWLNLSRCPQIDLLVSVAKFFKVSTDYLLGLEDEFGNKTG